jgi:hypothetical protein
MKTLITFIILLWLIAAAFAQQPGIDVVPFHSKAGHPCTFLFHKTANDEIIHAYLITDKQEIAMVLQDLYPQSEKILLSDAQALQLKEMVNVYADGATSYWGPAIPAGEKDPIYFKVIYKRLLIDPPVDEDAPAKRWLQDSKKHAPN